MKIGDSVYVGGATGKITSIDDENVIVEGIWYDFTEDNYSEPWRFSYKKSLISESLFKIENWNFSGIKPNEESS